jgi:hypothetical protein
MFQVTAFHCRAGFGLRPIAPTYFSTPVSERAINAFTVGDGINAGFTRTPERFDTVFLNNGDDETIRGDYLHPDSEGDGFYFSPDDSSYKRRGPVYSDNIDIVWFC